MRDRIGSIARLLFGLAVALALGVGLQQALASATESRSGLCEGTCPNVDRCILCCIDAGGTGGACVGPGQSVCICEA